MLVGWPLHISARWCVGTSSDGGWDARHHCGCVCWSSPLIKKKKKDLAVGGGGGGWARRGKGEPGGFSGVDSFEGSLCVGCGDSNCCAWILSQTCSPLLVRYCLRSGSLHCLLRSLQGFVITCRAVCCPKDCPRAVFGCSVTPCHHVRLAVDLSDPWYLYGAFRTGCYLHGSLLRSDLFLTDLWWVRSGRVL